MTRIKTSVSKIPMLSIFASMTNQSAHSFEIFYFIIILLFLFKVSITKGNKS